MARGDKCASQGVTLEAACWAGRTSVGGGTRCCMLSVLRAVASFAFNMCTGNQVSLSDNT